MLENKPPLAFLNTPNGRVQVQVYGQGTALLLAFHGYSDRAKMFEYWRKSSLVKYTVVAIDLPFHGETEWQKGHFTPEDLGQIIGQILAHFGSSRCSLLGFSFGARLVMGMLPLWAEHLDDIILCSPDGSHIRGMSWAEKTPMFIRKRCQSNILANPEKWSKIILFGLKVGLFSPSIIHFVQKNWGNAARRHRLLACWVSMGYFIIRRKTIAECLQQHALRVRVYAGTRDLLLSPGKLTRFYADLPHTELHWLQAGHDLRVDF